MKKLLAVPGCALFFMAPCWATEGGGGAYPNGAESFKTGYLPPTGYYAISYNNFYKATSFKNSESIFDDFNLEVFSTTARFINVTDKKILGGDWAMHALITYADVNVKNLGGGSQRRDGMADLIIDPFIVGWHFGNLHVIAAADIYLPVGLYDKKALANIGRNYVTIEPLLALTYLSDNGFEASAKVMFDYNFKNRATDYRSGNELHADFVVGQHIGAWAIGLGGYAYNQVTDDRGSGAVLGSFRGRAVALGPQVSYTNRAGVSFSAKYNHEFDVDNRPEGNKLWLNVSLKL